MSKDQPLSDVMIRINKLANDKEADPRDSLELFQQNRAALMNRFFGTPVSIADELDMSKLDDVITDTDLLIPHRTFPILAFLLPIEIFFLRLFWGTICRTAAYFRFESNGLWVK